MAKQGTSKKTSKAAKTGSRKKAAKKTGPKKSARINKRKGGTTKNSLVANINARKKSGTSRPKKASTVSKKAYKAMEVNWKDKK